jgi:hypothetical protein
VELITLQYLSLAAVEADVQCVIGSACDFYPQDQVVYEHAQAVNEILKKYKVVDQWASCTLDHQATELSEN